MQTISYEAKLQTLRIGFLGAGSIVEAMMDGMLKEGLLPAEQISVTNRSNAERLSYLHDQYNVCAVYDKEQLIRSVDLLILGIKPADAAKACQELRGLVRPDQLVISVVAGVSTDLIGTWLGADCPIVRAMPSTSSAVGLSTTGIAPGRYADDTHLQLARLLFSSIGYVHTVPEEEIDIITGLAASGPAFIYYLVEAMEGAGVAAGLSPEMAREMTVQTLHGAAQMLLQTKTEPSVLRQKITSPGGTTQAGLEILNQYDFQKAVSSAILRAAERARELGAQFE
ncbi:pyrroline-5-carboxylate reductase [Brevibacillus massiliensis]|jgi:pyrroline-5-carboxylate reductase|uniref:pyrroline-5-carboxylate reductase n=1 Tax=Brevibacillus massiliensis TaxID=1118054 RepID=UPI0002EEC7DF|nr:pyrroline-5-carboxylate reductase [Brevibacillus massiliensis]